MIKLRVPATTANLGPGFDCLGLALDLWNEVTLEPAERNSYIVQGEGASTLNSRPDNLLVRAVNALYDLCGVPRQGFQITASNNIPLSSGLGSSAAARLAGILGANEMLGLPLDDEELLALGTRLEGHPDNLAAALMGGLVISTQRQGSIIARRHSIPDLTALIVKPDVDLPTRTARRVLPRMVLRTDAVFNIGRTVLVVEALRSGDLDLLQKSMEDRLHQERRLAHIPAGAAALAAARRFGAAALSGAGPSIILFTGTDQALPAQSAVIQAFEQVGVTSRAFMLHTNNRGAEIIPS